MSAISSIGHWVAEHPRAWKGALAIGALGVGAAVLAGCADNTPAPTATDPEDNPLLNQLRSNGFSNRQQHTVLNTVHANNYPHAEAGSMVSTTAQAIGRDNAIQAWHLTKINNRDTNEISGMIQSLNGATALYSDQIMRVTRDVLATGVSGSETVSFFANAPQWTSTSTDVRAFENYLGLRYDNWDPSGGVIYEPYPEYQPNNNYGSDYWKDPSFWDPYRNQGQGTGEDYTNVPGPGHSDPSNGDDFPTHGGFPGNDPSGPSTGDDPYVGNDPDYQDGPYYGNDGIPENDGVGVGTGEQY